MMTDFRPGHYENGVIWFLGPTARNLWRGVFMTTPEERTRALLRARQLLGRLAGDANELWSEHI